MSNPVKGLTAYLDLMGDCEEELNFYAKIFDGKVTIKGRYDNPPTNAPAEFRNKVLQASLEFGAVTILASDIIEQRKGNPRPGGRCRALARRHEFEGAEKDFRPARRRRKAGSPV